MQQHLPRCVAVVESAHDDVAPAWPSELASLGPAVDGRVREFTTGRHCARLALRSLGAPSGPLLRASGGTPLWPQGYLGSISHTQGYRGAAVAHRRCLRALGIDAEPNEPLPALVLDSVVSPAERAAWPFAAGAGRPGTAHLDRLSFSAKEAAFKTWSVFPGAFSDFLDVELRLTVDDVASGTFTARARAGVLAPDAPPLLHGRWRLCGNTLLTAAAVSTGFHHTRCPGAAAQRGAAPARRRTMVPA